MMDRICRYMKEDVKERYIDGLKPKHKKPEFKKKKKKVSKKEAKGKAKKVAKKAAKKTA